MQRGTVTPQVILLSSVLGLLIAAFLWINEFPDYRADLASGRHNLVVLLGRPKAARVFVAMMTVAAVGLALLPLAGIPVAVWLGALFIVPAAGASRILLRYAEVTERVIPAQALTLFAFVLYSLGSGIGLLLAK